MIAALTMLLPILATAQSAQLIELLQPHDVNPLAQNSLPTCKRELSKVYDKLSSLQDQTKIVLNNCGQAQPGAMNEIYRLKAENARLTQYAYETRNENLALRQEVRRLQQLIEPSKPVVSPAQLLDACAQAIPHNNQNQQRCFSVSREHQLDVSTIRSCTNAFPHSSDQIIECLKTTGEKNASNQQIEACSNAVPHNSQNKLACIGIAGAKRLDLPTLQACARNNPHSSDNFINCLNMM